MLEISAYIGELPKDLSIYTLDSPRCAEAGGEARYGASKHVLLTLE